MAQGKGNKRGRSSKDSKRTARKAASKKARKLKKKSTQVGNPNKLGKKCFRYEQNSKLAKGISGKINNNIDQQRRCRMHSNNNSTNNDLRL